MATTPKFIPALIAGLLLVPASAAIAVMVAQSPVPAAPPLTAIDVSATTTTLQVEAVALADEMSDADALALACGADGEALVSAEGAGSLTPEQQAALDALRPICDGVGTPLAAAPEVAPVEFVRTVTVSAATQSATANLSAQQSSFDDDDDDHDESDDRDESDDHDESDDDRDDHADD